MWRCNFIQFNSSLIHRSHRHRFVVNPEPRSHENQHLYFDARPWSSVDVLHATGCSGNACVKHWHLQRLWMRPHFFHQSGHFTDDQCRQLLPLYERNRPTKEGGHRGTLGVEGQHGIAIHRNRVRSFGEVDLEQTMFAFEEGNDLHTALPYGGMHVERTFRLHRSSDETPRKF
jgi:hypothetical protein